MSNLKRILILLGVAGLAFACAQPRRKDEVNGEEKPETEPETTDPIDEDLYVFVHDRALIPVAMAAARRIEAASGLKVHVNAHNTIKTAIPIWGSDFLCNNGIGGAAAETIAIARNCPQVPEEQAMIHEIFHKLGVGHLILPQKGIMNDGRDSPLDKMSEDDLNALCAVRNCSKFQPEV